MQMILTKRGNRVVGTVAIVFIVGLIALAGRVDALDQCAEFVANNNYSDALDAGCSFDVLPNGEYPYTWEAN